MHRCGHNQNSFSAAGMAAVQSYSYVERHCMCHVIRRHLLPEVYGYICLISWSKLTTRLGTCLNGTAEVSFFSLDPTLVFRPGPLNPSWLCLAQPAQPGGKAFPDNFVFAHNPEVYATWIRVA